MRSFNDVWIWLIVLGNRLAPKIKRAKD